MLRNLQTRWGQAAVLARSLRLASTRTAYPVIPPQPVRKPQKVKSTKVWTSKDTTAEDLRVTFPEQMHAEIFNYVKSISKKTANVDNAIVDAGQLPVSRATLQKMEADHIFKGRGVVLIPGIDGLSSVHELRLATYVMTSLLGEPIVQNAEGQKSVLVYDRDASRKMADGQRYHQSHEGGSLHTDNVNVPDVWESMLLTCLQPAQVGGESIVVSVAAVHNYMAEHFPDSLETLQRDFLWEFRGFSDKFYKAPLLYYNPAGEPCMRYLRDYMESAHKRLKTPMTVEQLRAVDLIDCIAELSEFQIRATFNKGESLWCNDVQLLHGRTSFIDSGKATQVYDITNPVNRLYQRTWVKTDNEKFRHFNQSSYEVLNA